MEQKDYKIKIIEELLKNESHIRGMAVKLGTNHTTIARKVKELEKENVVDFRKVGKNKIYKLKKNIESRAYFIITEANKLLRLLERYPLLRFIISTIQNNNKISMALLFGSYAKQNAKKESDIDIYIESKNKKIKDELSHLDARLSVKIGKYNKENELIKEIEKNHVIIKGIERYYEKQTSAS